MTAQYPLHPHIVLLPNLTQLSPLLYLTGFPGLETVEHWIVIFFFLMYLVAISGNCFILIIVKTNPRLHTPMYYLLSFLAFTDLGLSVSTLPTTMGIFWFKSHGIYFGACQVQMFCIHSFSFMESSVLLVMSFDRFVAICYPLRYSLIITGQRVLRAGLVVILRGPIATVPIVFLLKTFPYCGSRVLSHSFCLHQEVIHLACTDTTFNNLYGLILVMFTVVLDLVLIALSYGVILHTVARLASKEERLRAFQTCTSHLCAVLFSPMLYLTGFPGMETVEHWIFIFFFLMYLVAISGNCFILIIVKTNPRLHTPMYYLLSFLAFTDLGLSVSTLPTTMGIFWFKSHDIYFGACQVQMFCIHSFSFMESSVLLVMSFDRFVAICYPLRYSVIITGQRVVRVGLIVILRGPVALIPIVLLLKAFPYCGSRVLSHSFCLHQEVIHLACTDTTLNKLYGLSLVVFTVMLDLVLIALSYGVILHTVARLASKEEQLQAFQTCTSHLCAVLVFFVPMMGLSLVHRFGKNAPPAVHLLMANVYLFVPPMLNPIIYSIKTKEIRRVISKLLG
ncbi:hypothetical protein R6Z07F_014183 [Ovis aries]